MTTSEAERDLVKSYDLHANAYVVKPIDLERFIEVVQSIEVFWFTIVKLPPTVDGD
jgi:AmiR/NasT family two-component response regulator